MAEPRPIPRRLRFEILRRDNHTCRYCGASAPDVPLTVDHVIPRALGGSDDPTNLVTACRDCNSGKTSTSPDEEIVADVDEHALEWSQAVKTAATVWRYEEQAMERVLDKFRERWQEWKVTRTGETIPMDDDWRRTVRQWFEAGLEQEHLDVLIRQAMTKNDIYSTRWRYFCWLGWRALDEIRDHAIEIMKKRKEDD